jgi:hypothetical protein
MDGLPPQVAILAAAGILAGLVILWRGFGGYRTASRISDVSTSRIVSLAAGEIRRERVSNRGGAHHVGLPEHAVRTTDRR